MSLVAVAWLKLQLAMYSLKVAAARSPAGKNAFSALSTLEKSVDWHASHCRGSGVRKE